MGETTETRRPHPSTALVGDLPDGCRLVDLARHVDERGSLTELYAPEWGGGEVAQVNVVRSAGAVLRGVHAHFDHADSLHVISGEMYVGLHDLRTDPGTAALVGLRPDRPQTLVIPPGVAHGFYFPEPTTFVYTLSHRWTPADELGCRWDDPELGIDWPFDTLPLLSARDQQAGSLAELRRAWRAGA